MTARSVVVACAMSVLLAACTGGEPLPGRRAVDQPTSLLYPESRFVGIGDFASMTVDLPADDLVSPGYPPAVVKLWHGKAPQVREVVEISDDANDAAKHYSKHDPRKYALDLLSPDNLVGESVSYAAPGEPESSHIYCDTLHAPGSDQCDAWTWWARYGQYTVQLYAGIGPSERTIDRGQFEKLVDLVAAHLVAAVGPPIQSE